MAFAQVVQDVQTGHHRGESFPRLVHAQQLGHAVAQRLDAIVGAHEGGLRHRVAQHAGSDRVALRVVGIEEAVGRYPSDDLGQLPAQVHRILHAGVEALSTDSMFSLSDASFHNVDLNSQDGIALDAQQDSPAHTHTVTIASHTHGIAHTHSTPNHVHTQTYDIFEDTSAPGAISVKLNNVNIDSLIGGPFTFTLGQVIDVPLTGILNQPGWSTLRFEAASGQGRIRPILLVKLLDPS